MQLELTLHSHEKFWGEKITVLYDYSDKEYEIGYKTLAKDYPKVNFIKQVNFKTQVIEYVKRNKYSVFFCDDDVMIRKMDNPPLPMPDDILCVSMRLDPKYTRHFETGEYVEPPTIINNVWPWLQASNDWSFPMSLLGHIFRSSDLLPLVEKLFYNSPNQLESVLETNPIGRPLMYCFNEAKTINIPANLVQKTHPNNFSGGVSVKGLNKKFLDGFRIDLQDVINKTKNANSCFMMIRFKYVKK